MRSNYVTMTRSSRSIAAGISARDPNEAVPYCDNRGDAISTWRCVIALMQRGASGSERAGERIVGSRKISCVLVGTAIAATTTSVEGKKGNEKELVVVVVSVAAIVAIVVECLPSLETRGSSAKFVMKSREFESLENIVAPIHRAARPA